VSPSSQQPKPRVILFTGKGGVGKTSVAASTALSSAANGHRTLVISTDPAHSLARALESDVGSQPTPITTNLWAQEISSQLELERHWSDVKEWMSSVLMSHGVGRITAEELTVPPGMDELFSLLVLRDHCFNVEFDTVIVDCAATGETMRLLSLPEIANWWLDKFFPNEKEFLKIARPLATSLLDLSLPSEKTFSQVRDLMQKLVEMNTLLRDHSQVSVRLVINPDRMVIDEAMRSFTYLNLYDYLTDAVVVNRIFPKDVSDGYFATWHSHQQKQLKLVSEAFSPVPILKATYLPEEVVGTKLLNQLADELYGTLQADDILYTGITQKLSIDADTAVLELSLPLAKKSDVSLKKIGLELIVNVQGSRRTVVLPPSLEGFTPTGANFADGRLKVTLKQTENIPLERQP